MFSKKELKEIAREIRKMENDENDLKEKDKEEKSLQKQRQEFKKEYLKNRNTLEYVLSIVATDYYNYDEDQAEFVKKYYPEYYKFITEKVNDLQECLTLFSAALNEKE